MEFALSGFFSAQIPSAASALKIPLKTLDTLSSESHRKVNHNKWIVGINVKKIRIQLPRF